ncbi:hypothetical protein [Pedobacter alluvionis]|uniref:Uncharacterized protein n=1 Tax=Pedobacter alluvionis TaxID=475253 RepID=A0A497XN54_9SPHI|nr:hypothetical protein [Pedobacter alluvionis]RLJ69329.1 hypothetical protein BCL90_5251 [Pedobacter alluvionis]TFB30297.1 hypothetical protein E3V97_19210 [Pedobacter alluvionis]
MITIEYFKLQAKNLHKDFKTQKSYFDPLLSRKLYGYAPKFFDVDALVTDFDIDEDDFTLMNAQHIIAKLVGFKKWTEMLKASPEGLELAKLLFDNMHKIRNEEWEYYIMDIENENDVELSDEDKLDIFKKVYSDVDGHDSASYDYRLTRYERSPNDDEITKPKNMDANVQISALPLVGADRKEFIEAANEKFEDLIRTMNPKHPELVRQKWNPEQYIDEVLKADMLPIEREYALSLVSAFLVHLFIDLDTEASNEAVHLN